jgi:hypothetical protein
MGFRAIVLSALWYWRFGTTGPGSGVFDVRCHKYLKPYPDLSDSRAQWKDASVARWFGNGYFAQYGEDISSQPIAQETFDQGGLYKGDLFPPLDITDYFTAQLLATDDLWMEVFQVTSSATLWLGSSRNGEKPVLDIRYIFPVEMYPAKASDGSIDLTRLLNTDNEPINLGALQKGETGTSHKLFLKNYSRQPIVHIEVWDDYPEWTEPAGDAGNGGSGDLDYIEVFEECVSQRWEIKFANATDYEVKAEMYLDNLESLHPQYDADGDWESDTSSNWSSPDGSVRIPSAAWSGTPQAGDLFVFYTRGNTTLNTWPGDSNDMVEMCGDSGGSPDGDWRPITAQRTILSAGATVDAATKTFNVKRINTSAAGWADGNEVYVANASTIDKGTIQSKTATSVTITGLSVTSNVYSAGDILGTTLPIRSLGAAAWAQTTEDSGASEANPNRILIEDADQYGFSGGQTVFIQAAGNPDISEEIDLDTVYSGYLLCDTDLVNDYPSGAFVAQKGSGEAVYHMRVIASGVTDEELKQFRMNVIT